MPFALLVMWPVVWHVVLPSAAAVLDAVPIASLQDAAPVVLPVGTLFVLPIEIGKVVRSVYSS